ncbi:MAG: hypothetical protein L0387_11050 [Acidobacteria bacterium]|nr:hypothetical protein [Acidobacteriota bacterium]MCI0721397.1 hypothetical protein [Acidobacteriota bacterium]
MTKGLTRRRTRKIDTYLTAITQPDSRKSSSGFPQTNAPGFRMAADGSGNCHPASGLKREILYYGVDNSLPEPIPLRAGPLTALFDPRTAFFRYVRFGHIEILRNVYVAVRDRYWDTVEPTISALRLDALEGSFQLSFEVDCKKPPIDFHWNGKIIGTTDGTIHFSFEGIARSNFLRCRIGFAVLHPLRECAGRPCTIQRTDGSSEKAIFPREVSPHQPFLNVRSISHEVKPGLKAEVQLDGEVFEMEDHRNWADGSFKTYCTPLNVPFPVEVRRGTKVTQSVTLVLKGDAENIAPELSPVSAQLDFSGTPSLPLPRLGLGAASHGELLTTKEVNRLRALNLSHIRIDLRLSRPDYRAYLERQAREARSLGVTLEVALFLTQTAESELGDLLGLLQSLKPPVSAWLVFREGEETTSPQTAELARRYLRRYDSRAVVGGGTDQYFAELNRHRPTFSTAGLRRLAYYPSSALL